MSIFVKLLQWGDRAVAFVTKTGVILAMIVLFLLLLARVIARATEIPFAAYDEVGELATVWLILLGGLALWREGSLYRVTIISDGFHKLARWIEVPIQGIMLGFALMLVWVGGNFTAMSHEVTAFMQIDMTFYYGAIPACGAVMTLYSLGGLLRAVHALCPGLLGHQTCLPKVKSTGPVVEHL